MRQLPFSPRLLILSTTLALLAAVGTYVVLAPDEEDDPPAGRIELEEGEVPSVDQVEYTTFAGESVPLVTTHEGTPLVVNFFSKDCVPCIKEMPDLEEVHQAADGEVTVLGLAVADRGEDAEAFVEQTGVTYETARDPDGTVIASLGGTILPTTVLLDASGEIAYLHTGALDADELRALVDEHLGVTVP